MGLGDLLQKAVYLGVGVASLATEKASETLSELKTQAQKLADEMVARGEMSTEDARKYVDDLMRQASQQGTPNTPPPQEGPKEPRRIEILNDDDEPTPSPTGGTATGGSQVDEMRRRVAELQDELRRLQK